MRALLVAVIALAGCDSGGEGDGGVLTPTPIDPSGQWTVTDSETRNTCSAAVPADTRGVLLTLGSAQIAWQDEGDVCDASPDFPYAGNQISGTTQHQFVGNDGCTYTETFTGTIQFTENNFTGSYRRTYTRSGVNCTDYLDGCEIRTTTSGARCQGCYGGCL
ncbi:MAG TPA: hypothetical protein VFV75_05540 [Candidatus Polarisedimenticolaceae bacterium]|nr:hypothetical protein [Candidatus Polarisedimenticolaceae bacterium]